MVMKVYRFLQFAPFSLLALSTVTASVPMANKVIGLVMFGGILLFVTTFILNIIWNVFGLWPRSEA